MNLFSELRPRTPGGHLALLQDGSPIPTLQMLPSPTGTVTVSAILRNQSLGGFQWHHKAIAPSELPELLRSYALDPEATLVHLFNWFDAKPSQVKPSQAKPGQAVERQGFSAAEIQAIADLL